jgi:hypothetical protein
MPDTMTAVELAQRFKKKYPQYVNVPDDRVAKAVLDRYPQYKAVLAGSAPSAPGIPKELAGAPTDSVLSRAVDRIGQNLESMNKMPGEFFRERSFPKALGTAAGGIAQGLASTTAPGMLYRGVKGEDPASLIGDAAMFFLPGGEEAARATHGAVRPTADVALPGPVKNSLTRSSTAFNTLATKFDDLPVDHTEMLDLAKRTKALEQYGVSIPAPITKFVEMAEKRGKPSLTPTKGGMIDTPGSSMPFTYGDMRGFIVALGDAIPWEQFGGPKGKMWSYAKQMREAGHRAIESALKPYGADSVYRTANADHRIAMEHLEKAGLKGYVMGKLGGYAVGSQVGHPLMTGYAGAKLGERVSKSMARSTIGKRSAMEGPPPLKEQP